MSKLNAVGVYYRKDNPNKPYTVRLFKMCKSKAEARKYLKDAHRFTEGSCRIALHKSSVQRYAKKAWEFVVQATFRHLWEALFFRAIWSEQIAKIS